MFVVYVIQHSITKQRYIGFTANLKQRIKAHNWNGASSTKKSSGKWILIYAEAYRNRNDAKKREQRLKHHGSAKHELFKRIRESEL